jgi:C1A family cysteine protease
MTIKRGTPLAQTGLLQEETLVIAKALSVTTLEELVAFARVLPERNDIFARADISGALEAAPRMMAFTFTEEDVLHARELWIHRGTGALPPVREVAEEAARLHVEDVKLMPGQPSDTPEVFLDGCLGPVRDQGDRGTCVAHAVTAMAECREKVRTGKVTGLSEQFLYWLCKMNDGDAQQAGTWQRVAIPLVVEIGICRESVWPYNPASIAGNESQGPPPDADQAYEDAASHRSMRGVVHQTFDLDGLRERLKEGFPVAISVPVFSNWDAYTVEQQGHIPMPPPGEQPTAGHAMLLVGYGFDDGFLGGGYVIVRNSWGTEWAAESPIAPGYGTLPFSFVSRYAWELFSLE